MDTSLSTIGASHLTGKFLEICWSLVLTSNTCVENNAFDGVSYTDYEWFDALKKAR